MGLAGVGLGLLGVGLGLAGAGLVGVRGLASATSGTTHFTSSFTRISLNNSTVALLSGPAPAQGDTSSATHSAQATPPTDSTHAARRKRNIPAVIPNASALPEVLRLTIPESARPAFARLFAQLDPSSQFYAHDK